MGSIGLGRRFEIKIKRKSKYEIFLIRHKNSKRARDKHTFDGGAGGLSSDGGGGARTDGSGIAGREPVFTNACTKGPGIGSLEVSSPQERLDVERCRGWATDKAFRRQ